MLTQRVISEILSATVTPPPDVLRAAGVTHWSARRLADWLWRSKTIAVSHDSIARLWWRFCLASHRTEGFKISTDPHLEAKVADVVGLYLNPPDNAVVVRVDEKSQCQALERTQPIPPMRSGVGFEGGGTAGLRPKSKSHLDGRRDAMYDCTPP